MTNEQAIEDLRRDILMLAKQIANISDIQATLIAQLNQLTEVSMRSFGLHGDRLDGLAKNFTTLESRVAALEEAAPPATPPGGPSPH